MKYDKVERYRQWQIQDLEGRVGVVGSVAEPDPVHFGRRLRLHPR